MDNGQQEQQTKRSIYVNKTKKLYVATPTYQKRIWSKIQINGKIFNQS